MRRTQFLTVALALVVSSASVSAQTAADPVVPVEASPAPSQAEESLAAPVAPVADEPVAKKSIVLGPEGVDDEGRVGRLHTVSRGDTLWDLSAAYLGTPWVWPSVWTDNDDIANPHLIRPGDRIWITANEMRVVSDDEADAFLERLLEAPAAPETDLAAEAMVEEPEAQAEESIMSDESVLAVAPEPSHAGRQITVSSRAAMGFVSAEQLAGASSIIDSPSERTYLTAGDMAYLGFGEGDTKVGDRYTIFDVIEDVRDLGSNRIIGHHVDVLGWVEVRALTGDTSIGEIRTSYSEIRRGARIMARPELSRHVTVLRTPEANEGQIVFLPSLKTVMADGDYVYLNRGELDGLQVGSELEVFNRGGIFNDVPRDVDVQAPDHKVATLVVVTLEPQTAVAFVLNASRELEVGDTVRPLAPRLAAR